MNPYQDCPHCGKEVDLYRIMLDCDIDDGESSIVECPHCEKDVIVSVVRCFSYSIDKADVEPNYDSPTLKDLS
jgi:endogenous inhibitor of DNA gyrase (YacG/DUF329 family)